MAYDTLRETFKINQNDFDFNKADEMGTTLMEIKELPTNLKKYVC